MKKTLLALLAIAQVVAATAQKKPLSPEVYDSWKTLQSPIITDNGAYTIYAINPAQGDGKLFITNNTTLQSQTIERGTACRVFGSSEWITYTIKPKYDSVRQAKIKKIKPDKMPQDTSYISRIDGSGMIILPPKSTLRTASNAAFAAYLYEFTPPKDTTKKVQPKKFKKLVVMNLAKADSIVVDSVEKFTISDNGALILYSKEADSLKSVWALKDGKFKELHTAKNGKIGSLITDEKGLHGAYTLTADTTEWAQYQLFYLDNNLNPKRIATDPINGNTFSANGSLYFNKEATRLHFGMAPPLREVKKDSIPDDEKAVFDLWSWSDTLLMTQQIVMKSQLQNQTFTAVYQPADNTTALLTDKNMSRVSFSSEPGVKFALGFDNSKYMWASTWEYPVKNDIYLVEIATGKCTLIKEGMISYPYMSPDAKYIYYYNEETKDWFALEISTGKEENISKDIPYPLYDEDYDMPTPKPAYGLVGWTQKGEAVIYDKYDLWLVGFNKKAKRLTNSRDSEIELRYVRTDRDQKYIDLSKDMLLKAFHEPTNDAGFYSMSKSGKLSKLIMSGHSYNYPTKAKDSDMVIFQRENFKEYRDLWLTNTKFENPKKISDTNPQSSDYLWGSVQHFEWNDLKGDKKRGLLYLPENYDPAKKYPTIVYFYETHSRELHSHMQPQPAWSIIIPVYYTSRDYVVFMPDITYETGHPGEGAYNSIISGSQALIDRGIADPKRMALQGQSWGGYQTAYLITRTDMFRAACAGALVSNMTSAFGGIRWGSGMPRMFQYERGQSRIGASLWDNTQLYLENSPLFGAPNVKTPLLMMHNDADDAVPWYQGIEYFLALRRLGVPVWFMNYNGQPHNLRGYAARKDWDMRMSQFFDYYLKDAPKPRWMKEGINITEKGKTSKFELE